MSEGQKPETLTVWRVITITSFTASIEFSFIKFYNKATTVQETHNKNRI